jgi:hypothetical protein
MKNERMKTMATAKTCCRALAATLYVAAALPSWAGTVKWNGSAGDGRMSTGANWDGVTAPAAGDTLDFSAVAEGDTIIADIANTTFQTITFGSRKFSVAGALTLTKLTRPYLMSVETGATVTVGALNSNRVEDYYLDRLDGTFVVTGQFNCNDSKTYGSSTARRLYRSGGGAFVVNQFRFGWNSNDGYMTADGTHLVLGSGGFEIGKKCFMYAKNATIGCTSDITLSRRSDMDPDNAGGQSTIHEGVNGSSLVLDTGDFYNPSVGHKIMVDGLISGRLALTAKGPGTVAFSRMIRGGVHAWGFDHGLVAKDGVTIELAYDAQSTTGTTTMYGGTTLKLPSAGATVELRGSFALAGIGAVKVKLGDGTETVAAGVYDVLAAYTGAMMTSDVWQLVLVNPVQAGHYARFYTDGLVLKMSVEPASITYGDGSELAVGTYDIAGVTSMPADCSALSLVNDVAEGCVARFYTEGSGLKLSVYAPEPYLWTGAVGDGMLATAGNWHGGNAPAAGSALYFDAVSATEVTNNLSVAPASVNFKASCAPVTVAGGTTLNLTQVISQSADAKHVFKCPVQFSGKILVTQPVTAANARDGAEKGFVVFEGGATGTYPENSMVYAGRYFRTNTGGFSANEDGENVRYVLARGAEFSTSVIANTSGLSIMQGARIAANTCSISYSANRFRLFLSCAGEYVVSNSLTITKDSYTGYDGALPCNKGATVKVGGITLSGGGYLNMGFRNTASSGTGKIDWYIGVGGMKLLGDNSFSVYNMNDTVRIHPWNSDFTIMHKDGNARQDIRIGGGNGTGGRMVFVTDDEAGTPRTITLDGVVGNPSPNTSADKCFIDVAGSGTLAWNSISAYGGYLAVKGGATLKVAAGATTGTGAVSVGNGATLLVSGAGTAMSGNVLSLEPRGVLAFNFTDGVTAPLLSVTAGTLPDTVRVRVSCTGSRPPRRGQNIALTDGGAFDGKTVVPDAPLPKWVKSLGVNEDGDIVLKMRTSGFMLVVK